MPVVAPEVAQWVRLNLVDVGGLGAALDAIWFSFDNAYADGLRDALVGCDTPAATLAESSAGILAVDESKAFFNAFETMMANGDANESDTTTTVL